MKAAKVTVIWTTGFVEKYDFHAPTPKRIEQLKVHYSTLSYVKKVKIKV